MLSVKLIRLRQESRNQIFSAINNSSTPRKSLRSLKRRSDFKLDATCPKLRTIFQKILAGFSTVNPQNFAGYLKGRYPDAMVEVMMKQFDFHSEHYETFVVKMNSFINLSDKELLKFCFAIYDFNRDGFICYKDAFAALQARTQNLYDDDFIIIRELLQMKSEGKLISAKQRRKSTFSMLMERIERKMKNRILPPVIRQDSSVRINFNEFRVAKFIGCPQILRDFFKYTCGFNYSKATTSKSAPKHLGKESESIVIDMNIDEDFRKHLMNNEKYSYYCELDEVMGKYSESNLNLLLEKFRILQSKEKFFYKIITKESMIEKFVSITQPILFGFRNDYLTERVFEVLSQDKYLTKARFLSSVLPLFNTPSETLINRTAFALYDARRDEKITVDELSELFTSLPYGSKAHSECLKMVNLFLNTIFEKSYRKVKSIDFEMFQEIVGVSCLGLELVKFVQLTCKQLNNRISEIFIPND